MEIPDPHDLEDLTNRCYHLRRKIKIWGRLQHEHILPLLGVVHGLGYSPLPGLVTPWVDNGTLQNFLSRRQNTLTRFERFCLVGCFCYGWIHLGLNLPIFS